MNKVSIKIEQKTTFWKVFIYAFYLLNFILSFFLKIFFAKILYTELSMCLSILFVFQMFQNFNSIYFKQKIEFNLLDSFMKLVWGVTLILDFLNIVFRNYSNTITVFYWSNFVFSFSLISLIIFLVLISLKKNTNEIFEDYKLNFIFLSLFEEIKVFIKKTIKLIKLIILKSQFRASKSIFKFIFMKKSLKNKLFLIVRNKQSNSLILSNF